MQQEEAWFVAYTYPRSERKVHHNMQLFGIESFLPLNRVRRVWSDRVKYIEVPLFANYIFVRAAVQEIGRLTDIPGICRFVTFGNRYARIGNDKIELIKDLLKSDRELEVRPEGFYRGQQVRVKTGPFEGLCGLLVREEGKDRFLMEIEGLKQLLQVNVPTLYLEKIN